MAPFWLPEGPGESTHSAAAMGLDWLAERMAVSMIVFTIAWVIGCLWRELKTNQRLALGDAFELTPRCAYFRQGSTAERSHLLTERAV